MGKAIYKIISEAMVDGALPSDFSIPCEKEGKISWADGAVDGICLYHTLGVKFGEEEKAQLLQALTYLSNAEYEKGDIALMEFANEYRMINVIEDFQRCILENINELNMDNLFKFAIFSFFESEDMESVKAAMAILDVFQEDEKLKKEIRIIGQSDEFTFFAVNMMSHWKNGNDEIFELAKKVQGWGKIHALEKLEPENEEIKHWILTEGIQNGVLPGYSALECYNKAGVEELLEQEQLSCEEVHGILQIIDGMLDEGPMIGISAIDEPEDMLMKVLNHAYKAMPLKAWDYVAVNNISDWQEECGEDDNPEMENLIDAILASEQCQKTVKEEVKKGKLISLAIALEIDYKEALYQALCKDFENNVFNSKYLMNDDNFVEKVVRIYRENVESADKLQLLFMGRELMEKEGVADDLLEKIDELLQDK